MICTSVSLRVTTKMCPRQALFTIFRVLNTYALAPNTLKITVGDSIPSANPTPSTTTRKRASERRQACEMHGTSLRSLMLSFENLPLPPRSWWLERGRTRAQHRSIDTMQAHLRSCIVPEKQFMALVDAGRTRSWLFMFSISVSSKSVTLRCSLRRHAEPMRRFVVLRCRSSTALSPHKDSEKNCMACFRGCWIEMCCRKSSRVLARLVPLVVTTVEIVPMKRTPSILHRRRIHRVPNLRVLPRCAASVEGGLHQHGRTSLAEWE